MDKATPYLHIVLYLIRLETRAGLKKGIHEKQERKDNFLTKIQMKSLIVINIVFLIKVITVDK